MSDWGCWERVDPTVIVADDRAGQRLLELHVQRYVAAAAHVRGRRVLDIACGAGYGAQMLVEAGATRVVGVDRSESVIDRARRQYPDPRLDLIVADAEPLLLEGTFDVAISFETIEHLRFPGAFIATLRDLLVDDGLLFLSTPLGETRYLDAHHLQEFEEDAVRALVNDAGLVIEDVRIDDWHITRRELLRWRRWYPETGPSWRELVFSPRGRRLLRHALSPGPIRVRELMVRARRPPPDPSIS